MQIQLHLRLLTIVCHFVIYMIDFLIAPRSRRIATCRAPKRVNGKAASLGTTWNKDHISKIVKGRTQANGMSLF